MALVLCCPTLSVSAAERVQPVGDTVVIVIDPGHGGTNQGTQSGHTIEKEMTMVTAKAMYQELIQYDNVQVYMTHTEDVDLSLAQRAQFAESVGADFLFSIHYNASENHSMYGSEVWVSCQKPYNAYGYQFGYLHLESMAEKGLFIRGVKNRQDGPSKDYYGIIRESAALSIPAVIIEHCYVDEERDAEYITNEEGFAEFGRADALSVAKYFGLKSTALGVDYSGEALNLQPASADSLVQQTLPDNTYPDVCEIELRECDYETGEANITVRAADYDSPLIYYDYSIDNGLTWSRLETWPGSNTLTGAYTDTFQLQLTLPAGTRPNIAVRAYNIADLCKQSNVLRFDQSIARHTEESPTEAAESGGAEGQPAESGDYEQKEAEAATEPLEHKRESIGTTTFMPVANETEAAEESIGVMTFLKFCLALVIVLFIIVLTTQTINYRKRRNRRHRR
ncbi:MAG: N-acetylmuramoyl-L-alanine amidase [Butyrivibrio sp.]|nr:N-acetylmuramoyl-L-alanine amidase [Muribaculum sp.]MCM1551919.1 N-acetylmuramoyl-L-alanine amidase [Butyrivibrio sp.]